MKEIQPINDKILVKLLPQETETAGGLYIPDTVKNVQTQAVVVSIGTGVELTDGTIRPIPLKVNDKILFTEGRGIDVQLEDDTNEYKIISIKDVIATIIK